MDTEPIKAFNSPFPDPPSQEEASSDKLKKGKDARERCDLLWAEVKERLQDPFFRHIQDHKS